MYKPPCLRDLLALPVYKAYFKKKPNEPAAINPLNNPWQVWAYNQEKNRWASRLCETYPEAYIVVRDLYKDRKYQDLCIVSRSIVHPMPPEFARLWDKYLYDWCGRCRRPTIFRYRPDGHHALKNAPAITMEDPYRCYYCGARKVFAGQELGQ